MNTQTVYTLNREAAIAKELETRFHHLLHTFFVPHKLSKPVQTMQFVLNDFLLLGNGYDKDYILTSVFEINRIVEFLTDLYDEFERYSEGRIIEADSVFPNSLTNTFFIVEDFYLTGKLTQPIHTLNDVISQWLYEQSESLDESRLEYLKEFNRISYFLIALKEVFDWLSKTYSQLEIPQLSAQKEERCNEVSQALSELWEKVENNSVSELEDLKPLPNKRSEVMFDVMSKMHDCKDLCLQLQGVLMVEEDEDKRIYYSQMYDWIGNKFDSMRNDLAGIFNLERSDLVTQ